jgi:hypothetical protein
VASQAARAGLRCIVVQEAFDSRGVAQPEIAEKTRACEAYGAEVMRLSVGPELFYVFLRTLKDSGYFNASLYTPYSVLGIETPLRLAPRRGATGRFPDVVAVRTPGGERMAPPGLPRGAPHLQVGGERRPRGVAHGVRPRLQPQVLHHRPHRVLDPVHDVARSRRRPAQRRPARSSCPSISISQASLG